MSFFKKILGGINYNSAKNLYGTVEDWEAASPSELKKYKENIAQAVEAKHITPGMLGRFLIVTGDAEEGERILNNAVQDGVENAEKDYSDTLAYYYVQKGKYNTAVKQDKWFNKWINASEKCVEQGQKNAESSLANIYTTCYGINDSEFENIVGRIVDLFEVATTKHQSMAALNYGRFIESTLSSDDYRRRNTPNYRSLQDAEIYFIQAVKDEKGTQFEESAHNSLVSFYSSLVNIRLHEILDSYFKQEEFSTTSKETVSIYQNGLKYLKQKDEVSKAVKKSLDNYMAHFDFVILASILRKNKDFKEIADNYVWQVSKKHFPNAHVTIPKDECLTEMTTYFMGNEDELIKEHNFSQAFYDFIEKILAKA
ncbi:hypothetical protein HBP99_11930 [Listeria booriae]|uniref:hypothetical protein n=1 Tax=Listeria booriae TaxID=1552123 RepID=UPI00162809D3|nr:hypothetical protein [Listeria booriae]MBC2369348.1 hypothetical protein [Listeria booriae]